MEEKNGEKKVNDCTFEQGGTDEVIAQVMDVYNDGAIDQAVQNKVNNKENK
ncbi:hypothetical protein [Niallia sp. 03133]|uniref:hypothetical protein n=1 Tax=Niallia sp. 03133 TaxID=3458060 RepID=UPI004044E75A